MSNRSPDQDRIDALYRDLCGEEKAPTPNGNGLIHKGFPAASQTGSVPMTDERVIELCRKANNAAKFAGLFDDGDLFEYDGDDSDADAGLLGIMALYTKDYDQLERLWGMSALGRREKFRREDYRRLTIGFVLSKATESYTDPGSVTVTVTTKGDSYSNAGSDIPTGPDSSQDKKKYISSVSFSELEEPPPAEEIVEGIFEKGWPSIIFGAAGAVKSIKAQSLGQAIADPNTERWLEKEVITAPVMYADFELNTDAQARRAYQIARGRGRTKPPTDMRYMSTFGIPRRERRHFVENIIDECTKHKVEVCFVDSLGLAIQGDAGKFEDVVGMFEEDMAEFAKAGITALMIGHQRRLQAGESNQSLGVYGSVFFENLARSLVQVEFVSRDRESHTVLTRLRPKKANFSELGEPLEVKTTFHSSDPLPGENLVHAGGKKITLEVIDLDDSDRAGEETLTAKERVHAAVRALEEAGPDEITEECKTLKRSTVRKCLTELRSDSVVENTGEMEGRAQKVRVVTATVPFSGNGNGNAKETPEDQPKFKEEF